jgi:hypothetical protein
VKPRPVGRELHSLLFEILYLGGNFKIMLSGKVT